MIVEGGEERKSFFDDPVVSIVFGSNFTYYQHVYYTLNVTRLNIMNVHHDNTGRNY